MCLLLSAHYVTVRGIFHLGSPRPGVAPMSSPRLLIAVGLLAALSLTGCGNPSAKLIGKWKMSGVSGTEDNPLAGLMTQMFKVGVEFKADGSCVSNVDVFGKQQSFTGSWRFVKREGNDLVIALKMPPGNQEGEVRISFKDNDHCSFIPPASLDKKGSSGSGQMDFVRDK